MEKKIVDKTKIKKENTFFKDYQNLYMTAKRLEKDTEGYNYKYVQLKDVLTEAKKLCIENNFIFIQMPKVKDDGEAILETQLIHKSGETKTAQTLLPTKDSNDPQKYGGAITYMRRYSLTAILGLEETDDDASEASKSTVKKTVKIPEQRTDVNYKAKLKTKLFSEGAKNEKQALEMVNKIVAGSSGFAVTSFTKFDDITEIDAEKLLNEMDD